MAKLSLFERRRRRVRTALAEPRRRQAAPVGAPHRQAHLRADHRRRGRPDRRCRLDTLGGKSSGANVDAASQGGQGYRRGRQEGRRHHCRVRSRRLPVPWPRQGAGRCRPRRRAGVLMMADKKTTPKRPKPRSKRPRSRIPPKKRLPPRTPRPTKPRPLKRLRQPSESRGDRRRRQRGLDPDADHGDDRSLRQPVARRRRSDSAARSARRPWRSWRWRRRWPQRSRRPWPWPWWPRRSSWRPWRRRRRRGADREAGPHQPRRPRR